MNELIITEENIVEQAAVLGDPRAIEQVRYIVDEYTQSGEVANAYYFFQRLQKVLKTAAVSPGAYQLYRAWLLQLQYIAFPMLDSHEQKELLRSNLLFAVTHGVDLKDRLHRVFYPYFRGMEDQVTLTLLLKGFEENEEEIGQANLRIKDGSIVKPLVKNWIQDYKQYVGSQRGVIVLTTYLIQSPNPRGLGEPEMNTLKQILSTYEWLRLEAVPPEFLISEVGFEHSPVKSVPRGGTYMKQERITIPRAPESPRSPQKSASVPWSQGPLVTRSLTPRILPPPPLPPSAPPVIQTIVRQTFTVPPKFTTPSRVERVATSPLPPSSGVSAGKPIPISQQTVPPPRVEPQKTASIPEIKIVEMEAPKIVEPPKTAPSPTTIFRIPSTPAVQPRPQIPHLREQPKIAKVQEPAKPESRPDLIRPAMGQNAGGPTQKSATAYKPPVAAPAAPHPTAVDRSHITVAPKLAGTPKEMVRPAAQAMSDERLAMGGPKTSSPVANRPSPTGQSSSTLDELRKIHAEEEKRKQELGTQGAVPRIMSLGASDFSVNEALIHAGRSKPGAVTGMGSPGGSVSGGEPPDVAEKLKKLEGNLADKPKDEKPV